jgi:hypothetical protein
MITRKIFQTLKDGAPSPITRLSPPALNKPTTIVASSHNDMPLHPKLLMVFNKQDEWYQQSIILQR